MVHLVKIDKSNVWDVIALRVAESQNDFVAENSHSIIDAYVTIGTGCTAFPFGIYDDEKPVGFLMIGFNTTALYEDNLDVMKNSYLLWRLMIDEKYQKQGYGREAVRLALEFIRMWPCGKADYCVTTYEPENTVAKRLYQSFGFEETGEKDEEEDVAVLKL